MLPIDDRSTVEAIEFRSISHAYAVDPVLDDLNLVAHAGEITCLLGASGSGKSTLLRLAAGLERVQDGAIWLNGSVLADTDHHPPPESRPVGLVFQDHVLFPHQTVRQNVAYGVDHADTDVIDAELDKVGLVGFGDRYPDTLSGGQQQRVALARALAPRPAVVLLDEPFASIDATLRRQLREQTRAALKEANNVAIIVTHDPEEALELADRIVVIDGGGVVQHGAPAELWSAPATVGVATLFGQAQRLPGQTTSNGVETAFGVVPHRTKSGGEVDVVVRPEAVSLARDDRSSVRVADIRFLGDSVLVVLARDDARLRARLADLPVELAVEAPVRVVLDPNGTFVFPRLDNR